MKKVISIFLAVVLLVISLFINIQNLLVAHAEETHICSFVNRTVDMIRENDVEKNFIPVNDDAISTFSTDSLKTENHDFQTCRLIVQASKEIETLNSIGIANGFLDYYIVQFASEEAAESAYEYYSNCDYVTSVSPERIYCAEIDYVVDNKNNITYEGGTPERLDFWGSEITGAYEVKDYIKKEYDESELPEIRVAVIDTGVDLNHDFLQGRLIKTGFNASSAGSENSEYDITNGHGTGTTGTIIDNTLDNVKVANYKIMDENGTTSVTYIVSAILQAVEDNSQIISMSFGVSYLTETEYNLLDKVMKSAYDAGCVLLASAGNENVDITYINRGPGSMESPITVAASNKYNMPTSWSSRGKSVDIMAPGEDVPVLAPNNSYKLTKGTSYSTPYVAAVVALMKTLYPTESNSQIKMKIESTADRCDLSATEDMYGYGVVDVIGASELCRTENPIINVKEGTYIDEVEISFSVPDGYEVYYTIDQTYPTKENGILYTDSFKIKDDNIIVHAVAFKNNCYRSEYLSKEYRVSTNGTNEMFEIDSDGIITAYNGTVNNLIIPNTINGITVTGLAEGLFSEVALYGIIFPPSIKKLPKNLFYKNSTIQYVQASGVVEISDSTFYKCQNLYCIDFPEVQIVGEKAFYYSTGLAGISLPECTYIGKNAFQNSLIRYAYLPKAKIICSQAFYKCSCLYDIFVPELSELRKESYWGGTWQGGGYTFQEAKLCGVINIEDSQEIPYGAFYQSQITRLEFSNVKTINSLPITRCKNPIYGTITVVLPSTLESCVIDEIPYYDEDDGVDYVYRYKIYGTKDSYAEQWAKENGYKFIEITPQTAIIEDLPDEYYSYMYPLVADVVGFNRVYNWYGTNTESYDNAKLLQTGKEKSFDPNEHKQYKYYYCVVKSSEFEGTEDDMYVYTVICENKSYKPYSPPTSNGNITIATPSNRYLKYGESINLYANATGLPEGSKIKWRIVEGSGVSLDASSSGKICTVTSKSNGDVIIEAYAVNKNGNVIVNENGNRICDREGISSEVSLWWIILYYIRQILSYTNIVVNSI